MENEFEWMWSNTTPQQQAVPFRSFDEVQGERNALKQELQQNEARIAELKAQLEQNRMNADELDRRLAANRAGIGDTATSLAHQRNIDDRAYKASMTAYANSTRETEKESLKKGQIDKLVADIQQAYIDMERDGEASRPSYMNKINYLEKQYKDLTGKDYVFNGVDVKKGVFNEGETVKSADTIRSKLGSMKNKYGRITKAQREELNADLNGVSYSPELDAVLKEINATPIEEDYQEKKAKTKAEEKAAIKNVASNTTGYDVDKNGGKVTKTARNGKSVTIERTADGSIRATCGSSKETLPLKE